MGRVSAEEILKKYEAKLESQLGRGYSREERFSQEYETFKGEMIPELSRYERWAKSLGNVIRLRIAEKDRARVQRFLDIAHLDVTASQALTLSILSMLTVFFATVLIVVGIYLINGSIQLLFGFLGLMISMFVFYYTYSMPQRLANIWRLKASSQMVPAILYVVVYMKHTSNLERAIRFASQHLEGPLALDFKKIFYDVEVGKFSTIKQSLENYLEGWRDYSTEFIESFHLIESSLFEPSETRRVEILEKALKVMLDGVYEKMLKYSREIRSPLTNVYMLGIILPTLGLALLPLASTLLGGILQWPHVFLLFNVIVPFLVFYIVSEILLKRPGGYGEGSTIEMNPEYSSYTSKKHWFVAALICLPILLIGLTPFIFQIDFFTKTFGLQSDYTFSELGLSALGDTKIFDFKALDGKKMVGPFGPIAALLSLFIPLGVGLFFVIAYSGKTKKLIEARENTKELEREFANSLFQLGNRIGDGLPAEIAFSRVAETTQGQMSSKFFSMVNQNIQQLGMSLESAIFDKKRGAIVYYPSGLISTSMRILVETVKKGLKVAARSLMSISDYVKNIDKINQRLKDLLAEIVSDMKSNMTFLAPLLAGIVVGLAGMITFILNRLSSFGLESGAVAGFDVGNITKMFDLTQMVPPYFLQISVGLYIIEVVFILTSALVTVNSGKDTLMEKYETARNLKRGLSLYLATALLSILVLSVLAAFALRSMG